MKNTKIAIAIVTGCLVSANVLASSLDFRHEFKGKTDQHASRVKMATSFDNNFMVDVEVKFKSAEGTDFMKDLKNNGSEIGLNYKWDINDQWALQPGMPIEFGASSATYKPQLRLTYKPTLIDGLSISGRYRLDIKPTQTDDLVDNKFRNRYTFNLGYKVQDLSLGLEMNYYKAHDDSYLLYDNKDSNYENNVTASYKIGNWTPWAEFGDVSVNKFDDARELRSRVGLRYTF